MQSFFVVRVSWAGQRDTVGILLTIPIALLAARLGWRWGLSAAAISLGLVGLWDDLLEVGLGVAGYLSRAAVFGLVGVGLGLASDRLRATRASERALFHDAADALVQVDASGAIVAINRAAEEMFGYPAAQVEGRDVELLVPAGVRGRHAAQRSRYLVRPQVREMGRNLVLSARHRDGHEFPVEISLNPQLTSAGLVVTAAVRDVSERVRAEEDLRESEQRYRALMEYAPEAIVVLDVGQGRFHEVNENAVRLFKLTRQELLAVGPVDVSPLRQPDGRPSKDAAFQHVQAAIEGDVPVFEWVHRSSDGRDIPCEVRLVRLPAQGGYSFGAA